MNRQRRVAITGAQGFLGWHLSCRLLAQDAVDVIRLGRTEFDNAEKLAALVVDVDTVIHIAGVNRADSDDQVEQGNVELAIRLATALGDRPVHLVFANSVQVEVDNPYGRGKRRAAEVLSALPGTFADVLLPNLFGEHGRPHYNSFVATFCDEIAHDRVPNLMDDRVIPLLHVQRAAEHLIAPAESRVLTSSWYPRVGSRGWSLTSWACSPHLRRALCTGCVESRSWGDAFAPGSVQHLQVIPVPRAVSRLADFGSRR